MAGLSPKKRGVLAVEDWLQIKPVKRLERKVIYKVHRGQI